MIPTSYSQNELYTSRNYKFSFVEKSVHLIIIDIDNYQFTIFFLYPLVTNLLDRHVVGESDSKALHVRSSDVKHGGKHKMCRLRRFRSRHAIHVLESPCLKLVAIEWNSNIKNIRTDIIILTT